MQREVTATAFELLLDSLDAADRDGAGTKYVELRENLIKFFTWRGCPEPEEHADETLNRTARRLEAGETIQDFRSYVFGVARLLCFDVNRAEGRKNRALVELPRLQRATDESETRRRETRHECLEKCLRQAGADDAAFMLDYYQGERAAKIENRKRMLAKYNLSASGLRMKALRLRERIENCVRACCDEREK